MLMPLSTESQPPVMIPTMLSDPAQMRIAGAIPACAFLLTAVCFLSPHGDCAAGEPRVPAVAVESLGLSDRQNQVKSYL